MVFRRKGFSRFSKGKTFDPVQVPSIVEPKLLSRPFTMKLRFNPLQYQLLFSWTGWRRSVRRIGGKFKYSRQIQNPSSLTRVTLGERSSIKILETGHWYYSIAASSARCCTCESRIITQKVIRFVKRVCFREDENRFILRWRLFDDARLTRNSR